MAVTVELGTDKTDYQVGEQITVTVTVDGADPGGSREVQIAATVVVDGVTYTVDAPISVSWAADEVTVESVTADGITFEPTGDPLVWVGTAA